MTKTVQSTKIRSHTFTVAAPQAREVLVAGSFNAWKGQPMNRSRSGEWSASIELKPGRHEFKFVIDGQWCCELGCDGPHEGCPKCVRNSFGTMNRVLEIH
ncbi:MAG: glycogen-binding domain-containing protein [Phycisphaerales bacterium]|nr:glycogen-binding domain-containing protein [Phycisphaerales bacterium]